jgi:hypothetical protein
MTRRHRVLDPLEKRTLRPRAGGPSDLSSLLHKDEAGYALNCKAGGQRLLRFRVNLAETQMRLNLGRDRRKAWGHLAARSAPSCPEIDQQRNIARCGVLFKNRRGQLDRLSKEQCIRAFPATPSIPQSRGRNAIQRRARRTRNDEPVYIRHIIPVAGRLVILTVLAWSPERSIGVRPNASIWRLSRCRRDYAITHPHGQAGPRPRPLALRRGSRLQPISSGAFAPP